MSETNHPTRTPILLGPSGNATHDAYASYLEERGLNYIRWDQSATISCTLTGDTTDQSITLSHGGHRYSEDDFSIFVQEPHGLTGRGKSNTGQFCMMEWLAYLWSICGLHTHVVNPPSTGSWGNRPSDRLLRESLDPDYLPSELISSAPEAITTKWKENPDSIAFTENLGTYYRKFLDKPQDLHRWNNRTANQYGFRVYLADGPSQLQQIFVGDQVFTVRNEGEQPVDTPEHIELCKSIRLALAPLGIGFFSVAFHESDGRLRVSAIHRDVPFFWFASIQDSVFSELTNILVGIK